jgi:hypothetical protein
MASFVARRTFSTSLRRMAADAGKATLQQETKRNPELYVRDIRRQTVAKRASGRRYRGRGDEGLMEETKLTGDAGSWRCHGCRLRRCRSLLRYERIPDSWPRVAHRNHHSITRSENYGRCEGHTEGPQTAEPQLTTPHRLFPHQGHRRAVRRQGRRSLGDRLERGRLPLPPRRRQVQGAPGGSQCRQHRRRPQRHPPQGMWPFCLYRSPALCQARRDVLLCTNSSLTTLPGAARQVQQVGQGGLPLNHQLSLCITTWNRRRGRRGPHGSRLERSFSFVDRRNSRAFRLPTHSLLDAQNLTSMYFESVRHTMVELTMSKMFIRHIRRLFKMGRLSLRHELFYLIGREAKHVQKL